MTISTIFLLSLWIGSHLLIIGTTRESKIRIPVFFIIGSLLIVAYMMKPYTYDLKKYSIYFYTGFIDTQGWHSPKYGFQFELDPRDTTGEPYKEGFEIGFRTLGSLGHLLLPAGGLLPRFDPDVGDFQERGPPRSDAMVLLIMMIGFSLIYISAREFIGREGIGSTAQLPRIYISGPIILGSIFFLLGSQNSLRQFLGVSIVILALSMLQSRRYVTCLALTLFSAAFHRWSVVLGSLGIFLTIIGQLDRQNYFIRWKVPSFLSAEILSLIIGVISVFSIKGIMVFGLFHVDIPMIGDLKPYVIEVVEYSARERVGPFLKAGAIFFVFVVSELLAGRMARSEKGEIRHLRRMLFAFVIPFLVYSEIFARIVVVYWAVEIVFMIWALNSKQLRLRLAGAIVFVAYGLAPNAINVLIGPNWLHSL